MNADTNKLLKKSFRQRGLTLIELAVVLLVLVGLAGLLLPYAGGFMGKTNKATSADAGNSLAAALLQYQALKGGYPQNLDALSIGTGTTPVSYLDDSVLTTATTNFGTITNTANIVNSLQQAGILSIAFNQEGTQSITTDGTPTNTINPTFTTGTTINHLISGTGPSPKVWVTSTTPGTATSDNGATIYKLFYPAAYAANSNAMPANRNVIVLGVGQENSAIGVTLSSAPVYFSDKAIANPNVTYGRFLAAFLVDTSGVAPAQLIGIVHAPDTGDGWQSLSSNISGFSK